MSRRPCQGLHGGCGCVDADVVALRQDLRAPDRPPLAERLCRACYAELARNPTFRILSVEEVRLA